MFTSITRRSLRTLAVTGILLTLGARPSLAGTPLLQLPPPAVELHGFGVLQYMTAEQMQRKVHALTGYFDPSFGEFKALLGTIDPETGARSVDQPGVIAVLFLERIANSVASSVLLRESFLDDDERVVFRGVDFQSPSCYDGFPIWLQSIWELFFGYAVADDIAADIEQHFDQLIRDGGCRQAYRGVLSLMLRHGALYYY